MDKIKFWIKKITPVTLSNQIFYAFATCFIFFSIAAGAVYYYAIHNAINDILEDNAIVISKQLGDLISPNMLEQNIYGIDSVIHTMKINNPNIRYIVVLDTDSEVIASTFHHGIPRGLLTLNPIKRGMNTNLNTSIGEHFNSTHTVKYLSNEGYIYDVLAPIDTGDIGYIRVGIKAYEWGTIFENTATVMILLLTILMFSMLFLSRYLIKNFLQSLFGLSKVTKEIAQGNFQYPLPAKQGDELDGLIDSMSYMVQEIENKNKRINILLSQTIAVQEEERLRISRELHDETGQALASLIMSLGVLSRRAVDEEEKEYLDAIREETKQAMERIRRIAIDLRPPAFDDIGVQAVFEKYISDWGKTNHYDVASNIDIQRYSKEYQVELNLFRILQECFTNVVKHANATKVSVILQANDEGWLLQIRDNGVGLTHSLAKRSLEYKHIGLIGIEERTQRFGGTFTISEDTTWSTIIIVKIPLQG